MNLKSISRFRKSAPRAFGIASAFSLSLLVALPLWMGRHAILTKAPEHKAFYFWKTKWRSADGLNETLLKTGADRLYMRFFDVTWNAPEHRATPVSPLDFGAALPKSSEIVPVVYITNATFLHLPYREVEPLADNVWAKVGAMAASQSIGIKELQIDCDWSDASRKNYFHFLDLLRRRLNAKAIKLSSTLRLHQIKYAERTGVPPVNSGMLMFYNFGRIKADGVSNSIFNLKDARHYAGYIKSYQLPIGISLPMFSWIVHVRDEKVRGLIEGIDPTELDTTPGFRRLSETQFEVTTSTFLHGRYFSAGDKLNLESTDLATTEQAATLALQNSHLLKGYQTIALFDLSERSKKYEISALQNIFRRF